MTTRYLLGMLTGAAAGGIVGFMAGGITAWVVVGVAAGACFIGAWHFLETRRDL
jgi:uncharacterized membrane protein (UPF0136 family)